MLHVAFVLCAAVGACTLVTLSLLSLWLVLVERARRRADSAAPARVVPAQGGVWRERRARTWDDVPGWVSRDREWAVSVVLLGAPAVADRTHVHVDFARRSIDWPGLLMAATSWPDDERLLVYTAFDLAAGSRDAKPDELAGRHVTLQQILDVNEQVAERVQAAVDVRRGRCDYLTALTRAGGLG